MYGNVRYTKEHFTGTRIPIKQLLKLPKGHTLKFIEVNGRIKIITVLTRYTN